MKNTEIGKSVKHFLLIQECTYRENNNSSHTKYDAIWEKDNICR